MKQMISFCMTVGVICLLYFILLIVYTGLTSTFYLIWPIIGASFLFLSWFFHHGYWIRIPLPVRRILILFTAVSLLFFFAVEGIILHGCYMQPTKEADYVIVLGSHVRPEGVSRTLAFRLDRALAYEKEHPDTIFVVSGGKGSNEPCSEADAMRDYLVKKV